MSGFGPEADSRERALSGKWNLRLCRLLCIESFVNRLRLTMESHDQGQKNILVHQFDPDGDAEKRFEAHDVIGRRCGVSVHERSTGNYTWPMGRDAEKQTHQPSGLACLLVGFIFFPCDQRGPLRDALNQFVQPR